VAVAPAGHAQAVATPGVGTGVPTTISEVVSGGYWQAEGRGGQYRVVLMTVGFEALSSRVFVEWIADPSLPGESPGVVATVEPELSSGQPLTWKSSLQVVAPGCVRIVLRGTHSMQPGQHPVRTFWALGPGQLVGATSSRRPPGCKTPATAARKSG
jgi:hypothetical protein